MQQDYSMQDSDPHRNDRIDNKFDVDEYAMYQRQASVEQQS